MLTPEARAGLAGFLRGFRAAGGLVAFNSNYRPRLWPDLGTARREIAAYWALSDIGLPSLDDEMALFGEGTRPGCWRGSRRRGCGAGR